MLILWRTKSKRWTSLVNLQSHEESRGPGTEAHNEVLAISQQLGPLLAMAFGCVDVLPKICGLIDVNALETVPPEGSVAIYENASLLEHSCMANTRHSFHIDDKGRPRITIYAITSIKRYRVYIFIFLHFSSSNIICCFQFLLENFMTDLNYQSINIFRGEHLSTMYTHALWSTRARREHLLATKYFTCRCKRCSDPTELDTHLGTLKCPCGNGFMLPNDPLNTDTDWSCNTCPGIITSSEIAQLTDRLEEEVTEVMKQANECVLSDLLSR